MNKFEPVYEYDKDTKEYLRSIIAQYDPLNPGILLMPANTTIIAPPEIYEKYRVAVYNSNFDSWNISSDYRGTWYNINTKEPFIINRIGTEPSAEYTNKKPWADYVIWQNGEWVESEEHKIEIKKTNVYAVIKEYMYSAQDKVDRYRNQKEAGLPTTDDEDTYKALLKYMQYLRDYNKADKWYEQNPKTFKEWL